jgi:DUF1365 family protein
MTDGQVFRPEVCFGAVMHERMAPVRNRFTYRVACLRIPLSQLDEINVRWLGIERPALFSLRNRDHGARDGTPLLPWIRALLEEHDLSGYTGGEVVLQTMPRQLGFVFNPVSFWFCHDADARLRVVLAEVSNTFGEHHNYLVHHDDLRPIERGDVLRAHKVFHVSPFFDVRGEYRFTFGSRDNLHFVTIDYWADGALRLSTRVGGRSQALDAAAMRRWLLRFPVMTLGVLARIHWQALRLWFKRVRFFRKPALPLEETTR